MKQKSIKKTIERIICLAMCLSLLGCGRTNALPEVNIAGQETSTDNAEDSMDTENAVEPDNKGANDSSNDLHEDNNESVESNMKYDVTLAPGQMVESEGYIDSDEKCYRVSIGRTESVEGEYDHLKDIFFIDDEGTTIQFDVEYPSKSMPMDSDRYVFNACDFKAEYVDVTFDGSKDIVIALGHAGAPGDKMYCVYVYENGEFVYIKSFEEIPNYAINVEEKCIEGEFKGVITKYIYSDHAFVAE